MLAVLHGILADTGNGIDPCNTMDFRIKKEGTPGLVVITGKTKHYNGNPPEPNRMHPPHALFVGNNEYSFKTSMGGAGALSVCIHLLLNNGQRLMFTILSF